MLHHKSMTIYLVTETQGTIVLLSIIIIFEIERILLSMKNGTSEPVDKGYTLYITPPSFTLLPAEKQILLWLETSAC